MIVNILHMLMMSVSFLYMFNKAHFAQTRIVALVPLAMLVIDACTAGADFLAVPLLALLMEMARLTVLGSCIAAMRRDVRMCRIRERKRRVQQLRERTAAIEAAAANVYDFPCYA